MTGREMLFKALVFEETPRAPWVPFAGVHAGSLVGADAGQVLRDENKLLEALMAVNALYHPDGQPVLFDLQLEAEILGCSLKWSKFSPPAVASHPLSGTTGIPGLSALPTQQDGRLPLVLNVMRRFKEAVGSHTALFGLVCGPFTLASHLRGNDIFLDMYDDPGYVGKLLSFCVACAKKMAGYYLEAGMDVIAAVDPLVSQISQEHFNQFLLQPYSDFFDYVRKSGGRSAFFVCGDASRNIEAMCLTKPDAVFVDENVDIAAAKQITDRHSIAMGGNLPLTTVMLHGTQQDNMKAVIDLLDGVKSRRGLIIAPGCDMPYAVPPENVIGAAQAVRESEKVREMLHNYVAAAEDIPVDLPDYKALPRPLMEVFTLDSDTCAACTYMMGAAKLAGERFKGAFDLVEYRYTYKENIARCKKMGVAKLPSIYINGKLHFSSIIPSGEQLDRAIRDAFFGMNLKLPEGR